MEKHEIEVWALGVIDRVTNGQQVEDSRVELKRDRIAGEQGTPRRSNSMVTVSKLSRPTLAAFLRLISPALAWNALGHKVVYKTAWDTLDAEAREEIVTAVEGTQS